MKLFIGIFTGLTVFLLILLIYVLFSKESVQLDKEGGSRGLYHKMVGEDPEAFANKIGIATDKYVFNCNMLGVEPKIEKVITARVIAIFILIVGIILTLLIKSLYIQIFCILIFSAITVITFIAPTSIVAGKAEKRKKEFESELPRFLDLLQTALKIELPIATAIKITAESVSGILSDELLAALTITEVGISNWQDALYEIAERYEVDAFSDFVLDIVTAYKKGSDITESVERQSRDLKTSTLLKAKEDASKATSLVLIPVVIFKMLPLMAILFLPVILQLVRAF